MDAFIGEIAALAAAVGFSVTSVCYAFAGRKINSTTAIAMSLPISWLIMLALHLLTRGTLFPTDVSPDRWFFLSTSGILAFVISLSFLLNAFQYIGPRLTMLIASFAPVLGALLAWIFLDERLPPNSTFGIAVVIVGILSVVSDRNPANADDLKLDVRRGVFNACIATLTQSTAFVLASRGVAGNFPPISATLIRLTAGMIAMWLFIALQRKFKSTAAIFNNDLPLFLQLTGAALAGPVIAGSLLLLALQLVPVGVATTLSHTTAIMLIPVGYFIFKERISPRAIIGTVVTIVGIAILFIA